MATQKLQVKQHILEVKNALFGDIENALTGEVENVLTGEVCNVHLNPK